MKRVLVLGSTGSIGESTLKVVEAFPEEFKVVGLVAGRNRDSLLFQSKKFKPEAVALFEGELPNNLPFKAFTGIEGIRRLIEELDFDVCVAAISGSAGILPTYWAARKGRRLALANKEALVCAGPFVKSVSREIIPVDSEHSAIFQCLNGERRESVEEIILTASGGPFREREDLDRVKPEEALKHPNWDMGKKVTIDSATLMNKGLEVIEAYWLFGFPLERIKVVIHPQSIVHSMVRFVDGSVISQMGVPDMKIPIAYALSYPERLPLGEKFSSLNLHFSGLKLDFYEPDTEKFPCLKLAYESLERGYPYPIVLNAADEVAVELFLKGKIKFTQIPVLIEEVLERSNFPKPGSIEDVVEVDKGAKELAWKVARRWL
ncbi:MAG: 1-deoxy-D-xylulose-5-phosphate reductoisomerase [Desulfurobacteriaceae bacterium]